MRRTGRVLLLDDANRVLLVGSVNPDPAGPDIWVPPGGGGERGEDERAAAARELYEETGLRLDPMELGDPVATCVGPGSREAFFARRVDSSFRPRYVHLEEYESGVWTGFRWWTAAEIRATSAIVFPHRLADLLDAIAGDGPPISPWRLPWSSEVR